MKNTRTSITLLAGGCITNRYDASARSHGYGSGSTGSRTHHKFYHCDGNGNVTALVNSGETLQASYIYDPYGRYLIGTGSLLTANVMRFSSKPWVSFLSSSTTSGLYYYGYRFYDPYLQRWLNRDPAGERDGANLYGAMGNDPMNYSDPHGVSIRCATPPSSFPDIFADQPPSFRDDVIDLYTTPKKERNQDWVLRCYMFCDVICSHAPCPDSCTKKCYLDYCDKHDFPDISACLAAPPPGKPSPWEYIEAVYSNTG